jgi:hypothetical protein
MRRTNAAIATNTQNTQGLAAKNAIITTITPMTVAIIAPQKIMAMTETFIFLDLLDQYKH